jgi:hypothetical protein
MVREDVLCVHMRLTSSARATFAKKLVMRVPASEFVGKQATIRKQHCCTDDQFGFRPLRNHVVVWIRMKSVLATVSQP